jgi:hypothetical protein
LTIPGVTTTTSISNVSFQFNTAAAPQVVPTPQSGVGAAALLGALALWGFVHRFTRAT